MAIESYRLDMYGGRFRVTFTLTDGREIERGPFKAATEADARALVSSIQTRTWDTIRRRDAEEAEILRVEGSYKEASLADVQSAEVRRLEKACLALSEVFREHNISIGINTLDSLSLEVNGRARLLGEVLNADIFKSVIKGLQ